MSTTGSLFGAVILKSNVVVTQSPLALSWILKDGIVTSVLVGASKPEQVLDNIKAIQNTEFTEEELRKIDELSLD